MTVAVATSSEIAAQAGGELAAAGGNAVDAAISAALVSVNTEPGVSSLAGGGFVTIWAAENDPVVIDGYAEMPGRGLAPEQFGGGAREVSIDYGGGVTTLIGHGSIATPGALAALGMASARYGRAPWRDVVEPSVRHTDIGFPLPSASRQYLEASHESIFGWHEPSRVALHTADGRLLETGDTVRVEHLAETLHQIAEEGPDAFYRGEIGAKVAAEIEVHGGILTRRDLEEYRAVTRLPLLARLGDWGLATNPPPALGGVTLAAMLALCDSMSWEQWDRSTTQQLIDIQSAVLGYRQANLEESADLGAAAQSLLQQARGDSVDLMAGETSHTSAVDESGIACSITISMGYGSGVMAPGTGLWLNNHLGELELNRRGFHFLEPGTRLASNMAPTVGRNARGSVLAIGSPGASRITTAILQVVLNLTQLGQDLAGAITGPRLHVERPGSPPSVAYEPGLPVDQLDVLAHRYDEPDMFFGGVAAAMADPSSGFSAAADPRRSGGFVIA